MISSNFSERLSSHAQKTLREAETIARNEGAVSIEPKHLLFALFLEEGGLGSLFLTNAGLKRDVIDRFLPVPEGKAAPSKPDRPQVSRTKRLPLSRSMKTILSRAYLAASQFQSPYVGTEHLTYSLFENPDSEVTDILDTVDIKEDKILDTLEAHLGLENFPNFGKMLDLPDIAIAKKKTGNIHDTPFLSQYATDLGEEAILRGDEFFGREQETDRVVRILGRKHKNNPLLIGEPGVGKTALIAALGKRIATGDAPDFLAGKRILSLDLALVVAGTSFRGEFESRLKEIVREASEDRDVILFIDELHTIVGAGNTQGGLDAANILKPALARGDIRVIGATTLSEYKRHIEKDPALDRRFQSVLVREPSPEETKRLLRRIRNSYESFHGVSIGLPLLDLSVDLSVRHMNDRFLPDKAIDILDEASSLSKNRHGTAPEVRTIAALESARKNILSEKELLMSDGRFDEAAEMLEEEKRISAEIAHLSKRSRVGGKSLPRVTLLEQDLLETVSAMTGIPFSRLERERPQDTLEAVGKTLRETVVHQEEAAIRIESALARALSDTRDPDRPIGSFLLLGPTGVGKTLVAKTVAESFFGGRDHLIRLDMSEFMERHSVAAMIGAPAGYVGYGDGGKLTERIRRTPHAVVLFDEIEKAHPDVFNILLQILDEGRLTDAEGRSVSFRHALIVLTSNIGTEAFTRQASIGFREQNAASDPSSESVRNEVLAELKKTLRPELLARIDHTVIMNALGTDAVEKIARLELAALRHRLARKGVSLSVPASVTRLIAEKSFAPEHGARLVRKHIDELVEHAVARTLLRESSAKKRILSLSIKDGTIVCKESSSRKKK
ncbi:MAG: ATP-dependent Clp protease ATP-binding subunit [Candidatus Moranbacteria bacterium]|nr:ATP-dependent Clp protease ATP-binding subunit [Candidatus Moranbacteria bacterium]